ncbi:MAG TPA: hypothetical protein VEA69_04820 [Tepidisphaeraceae bacterium]|nr:hypothetical protein [Tepidisphaeraceae bacterium]
MSSHLPILLTLLLASTLAGAQPTDPKPKKVKLPPEQRFLLSVREKMGVTDDAEWALLAPRVTKVALITRHVRDAREAERALEGKLFRMPTPQNPDDPPAVVYPAQTQAAMANLAELGAALKAELDNPDARAADIGSRLAAFRRARADVDRMLSAELARAREHLRELLTPKQELALIARGLLD